MLRRKTKKTDEEEKIIVQPKVAVVGTFERLFGFRWQQLLSWSSFVRLMCRPCDPASLAVTRILFGVLMGLDTVNERGFRQMKTRFEGETCFFPLFDFIRPLDEMWWGLIFLVMCTGIVGITFGLLYRLSCVLFALAYWYRYVLFTETWNNHSYLYGLVAITLTLVDGHHYGSLDMLYRPQLRNAHVPLWNYVILRAQLFIVYFVAGIKKMDPDWLMGYSMSNLSGHWIFDPFKLFMSDELVSHVVIHGCGFLLDLTVCFFLFFDASRPVALLAGAAFHLMNAHMFNIGMFPYTMLATLPLFCYPDWPRHLVHSTIKFMKQLIGQQSQTPSKLEDNCSANLLLSTDDKQMRRHQHCLYDKTNKKQNGKKAPTGRYHHWATIYLLAYTALQAFLPFSHFITKGYNHWRQGLYGYSWDMMVHNQHVLHSRIYVHFVDNGTTTLMEEQELKITKNRWNSYGRLAQQMARCVEGQLRAKDPNLTTVQIYIDVWKSLNDRIVQRFFDPRVDILTAEWSPFAGTPWVLPLLNDSETWRNKAEQISEQYNASAGVLAAFIADFPGLTLENCVQPELIETKVEILEGEAILEIKGEPNVTLRTGDTGQLKSGQIFKLHATSSIPTTYFFVATNETLKSWTDNNFTTQQTTITNVSDTHFFQHCQKIGMNFDFAFEGDVDREIQETQFGMRNVSYFDSFYRVIDRRIKDAIYNYNEAVNVVSTLLSKYT